MRLLPEDQYRDGALSCAQKNALPPQLIHCHVVCCQVVLRAMRSGLLDCLMSIASSLLQGSLHCAESENSQSGKLTAWVASVLLSSAELSALFASPH
jgi:hypothetical protein